MKSLLNFICEAQDLTSEQEEQLQLLKDELENLKYPDYVDRLQEMIKDPKFAAMIKSAFGGDTATVQLSEDKKPIKTSKLLPTQNEIDVEKSLKRGLTHTESIEMYFNEPVELFAPLITYEGNFIIDGHHRWSQVASFNPSAKCTVINFKGDLNAREMLKASQGTIAADTDKVPTKPVKGLNLLKESVSNLKKYIEENITDEVVAKLGEYVKKIVDKKSAVKYIINNIKKIQANNTPIDDAGSREHMPQTDTDSQFTDTIKKTTKIV